MADNKKWINDNTARIEALTRKLESSTFAEVSDTTATAEDVIEGKDFYGSDGVKTTGVMKVQEDVTEEVEEQVDLLANLELAVDKLPEPKADMLQERVDATNSCNYLFYNYSGDNVDFAINLDTSNSTGFDGMFQGNSKLKTMKIKLKTEKAKSMSYIFKGCKELEYIEPFDIPSGISSLYEAFSDCDKLTETPLWLKTENVGNLTGLFNSCSGLITAHKLDLGKAYNIMNLYTNCSKMTTVEELDLINKPTATGVFSYCTALENVNIKNIQTSFQLSSGTSYGNNLTIHSLLNTIKELWDNNGSTSILTLTINSNNISKLSNIYIKLIDITDEMRAEDEYIDNKKPFVQCESTDAGAMTINEYVTSKNWALA